jgi:hypothetical protein
VLGQERPHALLEELDALGLHGIWWRRASRENR